MIPLSVTIIIVNISIILTCLAIWQMRKERDFLHMRITQLELLVEHIKSHLVL